MYTVNRVGIGLCVLRMLEIFSGSREPEVEVVVLLSTLEKVKRRFIEKGGAEDAGVVPM